MLKLDIDIGGDCDYELSMTSFIVGCCNDVTFVVVSAIRRNDTQLGLYYFLRCIMPTATRSVPDRSRTQPYRSLTN